MVARTLSGVIAAIATPIDEDGAPDLKRAVKLARYLLDNGCDGLNVLGTTGEATSFSLAERKAVMDAYKANGLPLDRLMVESDGPDQPPEGHPGTRTEPCDILRVLKVAAELRGETLGELQRVTSENARVLFGG